MNEFDVIARYFAPLARGHAGADGLRDDGAVLRVPEGYELVVTSDTLNAGMHFLSDEEPENIAHKALRTNLSDLASMGAEPWAYQLNLALSGKEDEGWFERFSGALASDQKRYGIALSGGDTTRIDGPLSVSITAMGLVPSSMAVRRSGAQAGDVIILSGAVGDAYLGLQLLRGHYDFKGREQCIERYRRPLPRVSAAEPLRRYAHAAADISDGLIADLGHIAAASHLSACVDLSQLSFSEAAWEALSAGHVTQEELLSGGDDYELLIAAAPDKAEALCRELIACGCAPQLIGHFEDGLGQENVVQVRDEKGRIVQFETKGWRHF